MFVGKTVIERLDKKYYILKSTLSFKSKTGIIITIKPGFITDGASIPKMFWGIIGCPLNAQYIGSAIIHDGLYKSHALTKKESDLMFKEMLEHNQVHKIKINAMYYALKFFGYHAYRDEIIDCSHVEIVRHNTTV